MRMVFILKALYKQTIKKLVWTKNSDDVEIGWGFNDFGEITPAAGSVLSRERIGRLTSRMIY